MYLKAVQMKGFKSFPGKTRLDFGPGVSVIVGPNGSGKSNISDAIVWALGEQSAAAVRGGQMQDLLFGGADGVPSAAAAEVELVFDNSDGTLDSDFNELSITRRLGRDGEGEYRINGARCRLVDVIEVLSDTGLGKEMHSVLSQGKVDEIVASKPKDRRLLVEEAAGLGKHRKRRRRAQLKLAKTRDNLDRVLDVEREARSRLRPLKRQAEAAETHARLELQANELRAERSADQLLRAAEELGGATALAASARERRGEIDAQLVEVARLREVAEQKIAAEAARRERATESLFSVRSACERLQNARERTAERITRLSAEIERADGELGQLELDVQPEIDRSRIEGLRRELAEIERHGRAELETELAGMRSELESSRAELTGLEARADELRDAATTAEQTAASARDALSGARDAQAAAHRERARLEGELAAVEQFLRETAGKAGSDVLARQLAVEPGFELAVAAVLGRRLRAVVVEDLAAGEGFLDALGEDGGSALLPAAGEASPIAAAVDTAPPGGVALAEKLSPSAAVAPVVRHLLAGAWLVDSLSSLPRDFRGIAVTAAGRVYFGATGELRQAPAIGEQRTLSERNRRDRLARRLAAATAHEEQARSSLEKAEVGLRNTQQARDAAHDQARLAQIACDALSGTVQGRAGAIERRIEAGLADGPTAVRRAAIEAELRSESAHAESLERAAEMQRRRRAELEDRLVNMRAALPVAEILCGELAAAAASGSECIAVLAAELDGDRAAGERLADELREHASSEARLQSALREQGEQVTTAEVRAQRARDLHAEAAGEVAELAAALGREIVQAKQLLDDARIEEITAGLTRIARRRELLGPINPLARDEYAEALAHVEELEAQRDDLETALNELNDLIKQIDRTIRTSFEQTFTSTSAHFQELVGRLFPGGEGRLNLVREERPAPAPLLATGGDDEAQAAADAAEAEADMPEDPDALIDAEIEYGVEIEVRLPGSKSGRRLSLLSGGERSLVALAFLFSVFLTRPCPFYVFDEAEAALDDVNIDRLVGLLREHSDNSQFIVITHQKRTMDAADCLYGVSMGADGISKVITRRLASAAGPVDDDQPELAVA